MFHRLVLVSLTSLLLAGSASARLNPQQLGPFRLGMTMSQFRAAAERANFTRPRALFLQERDVMGLGLMTVIPVTTESRALNPEPDEIWQATAYLLSGRVVYLNVDYSLESVERAQSWWRDYDAPTNARRALQDSTWTTGGVVLHGDRFGKSLHAVAWEGLRRSDRAMVTVEGAIAQANEFFRRLRARQVEASLEHLVSRVTAYYAQRKRDGEEWVCRPPASAGPSPGETACDLDEKRFPERSDAWSTGSWSELRITPASVSRYYSYTLSSSGEGANTRIVLTASGDLDCDGDVATLRVLLRANIRAATGTCELLEPQWELINPFE